MVPALALDVGGEAVAALAAVSRRLRWRRGGVLHGVDARKVPLAKLVALCENLEGLDRRQRVGLGRKGIVGAQAVVGAVGTGRESGRAGDGAGAAHGGKPGARHAVVAGRVAARGGRRDAQGGRAASRRQGRALVVVAGAAAERTTGRRHVLELVREGLVVDKELSELGEVAGEDRVGDVVVVRVGGAGVLGRGGSSRDFEAQRAQGSRSQGGDAGVGGKGLRDFGLQSQGAERSGHGEDIGEARGLDARVLEGEDAESLLGLEPGEVLDEAGGRDAGRVLKHKLLQRGQSREALGGEEHLVGEAVGLADLEGAEVDEAAEDVAHGGGVNVEALELEDLETGPDLAGGEHGEAPLGAGDVRHFAQAGAAGLDLEAEGGVGGLVGKHALGEVDVVQVGQDGNGLGELDVAELAQHVGGLEVLDELSDPGGIVADGSAEESQASLGRVLGDTVAVEAASLFAALGEPGLHLAVVYGFDADAVVSEKVSRGKSEGHR